MLCYETKQVVMMFRMFEEVKEREGRPRTPPYPYCNDY